MEPVAETIETPVGVMRTPLHPGWPGKLARCSTNEELFALVDVNGFIDPDALNEVLARRLYGEYFRWKQKQGPATTTKPHLSMRPDGAPRVE